MSEDTEDKVGVTEARDQDASEDELNVVSMICRRSDSEGGSCGGNEVEVIPLPNNVTHATRYRCLKCGGTWVLNVGGTFNPNLL